MQLGNLHGVLTVDVDGEDWTVEVGQPWRNERAGMSLDLQMALLASATAITNVGPGFGPIVGPAGNFASLTRPAGRFAVASSQRRPT